MKKLLKEVLFLAAGMMLCFTSCSNGSDDPARPTPNVNSNGSGVINASAGLKFDFSGAKALAAVDSGALTQGTEGESTADSPLIKFLEDGSAVAAVTKTGSGNLSKIKKIYKSPVASSKDVFVVFENQSWLNGFTLGTFVCVHEDGSIADILKKTENTNNGNNYYSLYNNGNNVDIKFDGAGNAYFMISDYSSGASTTLICKFNPSDNSMTQLTAGVSGNNYDKFIITSDGQLILVSGTRWNGNSSTVFLRAIPISDPNHFTNIYYKTTSPSVYWEYDDVNGICYFYAEGFARSIRKGSSFSEAEKLYNRYSYDTRDCSVIMTYSNDQVYSWNKELLNLDGSPNKSRILNAIFNLCYTSGEKQLTLATLKDNNSFSSLYSESTDEDAIEFISSDNERMRLFYDYLRCNGLMYIVVLKGTSDNAFRLLSDDEKNISFGWNSQQNFYFSNSEGLWKTYCNNSTHKFYLVHVTDSKGYPIWTASKIDLPSGKMLSSQLYNGNIYVSYSLLTSYGEESGYQQIYKIDLSSGAYKNLFQNVPNNSMLEVISYSVGSDLLYYSAVRGTAVENGVVNVTSGEYNPLSIKKKLTAIYTF